MANETSRDRELVLPPNTSAQVLDTTKGKVSVYVGPYKNSLSTTDQLVAWDPEKRRFVQVNEVERAIQVFPLAGEGEYIVLSNPVSNSNQEHPGKGTSTEAVDLDVGRKVNIPGPVTFPLWPGQTARTIGGHRLRNNQHLLARVYDDVQAARNWRSAVVKPQVMKTATAAPDGTSSTDNPSQADSGSNPATSPAVTEEAPTFTMGQLILVKGTEVSFYIPPTGIEVVPEEGTDNFVREAVTLERLEHCILLDENGQKRYVQGPAVVFPEPTETFIEAGGNRKYRALELNDQTGLYLKVIAPFTDGDTTHKVGDELFITGKEQAIYFPRAELSIIDYDGRQKHFAIALPGGEGRYVLDRTNGTVDLVQGPKMFLPDPRKQVVVLRILDDRMVELLYPGNQEAIVVNASYREMSTRLSPGQHLESGDLLRAAGVSPRPTTRAAAQEFAGETMRRGSAYTPPRTLVLDTKYEGAVAINIWPGYAVLVTDKIGNRRVEVGPKTVLLKYDETPMPLTLSTGRPKDDKRTIRTAYLQVQNNQVGDLVTVETKDLVKVAVLVSYRVNFEGSTPEEQQKWFAVENYVKVLTDHARSRIRNAGKRHGIEEFYTKTIDIIRDAILGAATEGTRRAGLPFTENGMHIYDVEVLDVSIEDPRVASLLVNAQSEALKGAIEVSAAEEKAKRTTRLEVLAREDLNEKDLTAEKRAEIAKKVIGRNLEELTAKAAADLTAAVEQRKVSDAELDAAKAEHTQEVDLKRMSDTQAMEHYALETTEIVKRMGAMNPELTAALTLFGEREFAEKVVKAMGPAAIASGTTTADMFKAIFKGTPFESLFENMAARPLSPVSRAA